MKIEFITKKELLYYINSKIEVYNRRMEECEKDETIGDHIPLLFEGKIESLVDLKNYITDNEPIDYGDMNHQFKEKYNIADIKDITFTVDFGEEVNNLLADEEDYIPPGVRNKLNSNELYDFK